MIFQFPRTWRDYAKILAYIELLLLFVGAIVWSKIFIWTNEEYRVLGNWNSQYTVTYMDRYDVLPVFILFLVVGAIVIVILTAGALCLLRSTKSEADPVSSFTSALVSTFLHILANLLCAPLFLFSVFYMFGPGYSIYYTLWDYLPFLLYLIVAVVPLIVVFKFTGESKTLIRNALAKVPHDADSRQRSKIFLDSTDCKNKWRSYF